MARLTLAAACLTALSLPATAQEEVSALGWALLPALEGLDDDGDGLLSPEEIGGTRVPEAFDLDGDGLFGVVELSQGYWALADTDDSGYLEDEEVRAMRGLAAAGVYEIEGL
ncbi:MAG: hypothetical protein AAF390_14520 [Pseudomonadota bacterium]